MCFNYNTTFVIPMCLYHDEEYNNIRRGYIILIATLMKPYIKDDDNIQNYEDMIISIEKSCYDDSITISEQELLTGTFNCVQFVHLYRTRVMRITKNMDETSEVHDNYLVNGLMNGTIDPTTVSQLENKDLSPRKNLAMLEELNTRMNQEITLKTSSIYTCRKCHRNKTTITSQQMRSLDEPSTLVITCVFCHHKWFS